MINWRDIDTVLLDMDGTLLDLHFDNHFWLQHLPARYAAIHGVDPTQASEELYRRISSVQGSLDWYCLDYWSQQLQLDITALKREVQHLIQIRPHVDRFLQQLQQGPQQVLLVTNAHRAGLEIKFEQTGIDRWFDQVVVSHDYRQAKEQQAFWQQLQAQHPFDSERTLLIDDNSQVLAAARDFGIRHLLTMLQPDSQQAARQAGEFPGILHFDEIMPDV